MTRLLLVMTFAAITLVPQISEAQLFRRGFRPRAARPAVQQPRTPIFQNPRANGIFQPRGAQPQPSNAPANLQRQNRGLDALQSVLDSTVDGRPITRPTSVLQAGQVNQLGLTNQTPTNNVSSAQAGQVETPRKRTYSILVTPDKPASQDASDSNSGGGDTSSSDSNQTQLDITTPPIEPVEVIQPNSILQIVETPPKNGGI